MKNNFSNIRIPRNFKWNSKIVFFIENKCISFRKSIINNFLYSDCKIYKNIIYNLFIYGLVFIKTM